MKEKAIKEVCVQIDADIADPDIESLAICIQGMEICTQRMRKATLRYLWDRYVEHPKTGYSGK